MENIGNYSLKKIDHVYCFTGIGNKIVIIYLINFKSRYVDLVKIIFLDIKKIIGLFFYNVRFLSLGAIFSIEIFRLPTLWTSVAFSRT